MRYHVSRRTSAAPGWSAVPSPSFTQGTAASYSLSAISSDPTSAPITYTSVGAALPTGVTINNTTKALDYSGGGSVATTSGIRLRATSSGGASDSALFSLTIAASDAGGLFVGSYSGINLQTYTQGYEAAYSFGDHQTWNGADPGVVQYFASGGLNNGAYYRLYPPVLGDRGAGLSVYNLSRGGTFAIRKLNAGFVFKVGPTFCSTVDEAKWLIAHTASTPGGATEARPMLYLTPATNADNPAFNRAGTLACAPAQGTTKKWAWSSSYATPLTYFSYQGDVPVYWADAAATFQGRPVLGPPDYSYIEYRMDAMSTATYPNGLLAMRVYLRNGTIYQCDAPWTLEGRPVNTAYFNEIQMFGTGYYNQPPLSGYGSGSYVELHSGTRLRANFDGWMGPPPGFLI